ncbi:MAG: hypothetical protein JO080_13625, partial [Mucilaginibacter sp.]|nr:hypothetical protein [Mucilaginibacter sp.]
EERAWRGDVYFDALLKSPRSRLGIGEHDRAEAYIFGNGSYPDQDKRAHLNHFPVSVKVMTMDELYIAPREVVDLTAYADEFPWPIGEEEIYLHLTINRLILSAQSKIVVKGNVFILNCLKAIGNNISEDQAIIELGSSNSVQHSRVSRLIPTKGNENKGCNGIDGEPLKREPTPLGVRVIEGSGANEGQKGGDGSKGIDGSAGPNGAMLFLSDLRFKELEGFPKQSIKLKAGAGPGFPGCDGGDGGNGGNGGNGASGALTPFGMIRGFSGGAGGHGGNGGDGGRGGHGGLACDVFVSIPPQKSLVFHLEAFASPGGTGGNGGKGGKGGAAGTNGNLFQDETSQSISIAGEDGMKGLRGCDGKTRCAPNIHIYEQP